jgi:excisionase family DNA binding protein
MAESNAQTEIRADPETISVRETAKILGIGVEAAYQGVRNGDIPCIRIGRFYKVPIPALKRLLNGEAK